jgi:hypothetical protein
MEREGIGSLWPVPSDAAGLADWVVGGVHGRYRVGSLIPVRFAAFARLFHPAHLGEREVRWAQVAAANGRRAHAGMQWVAITGSWDFYYGGAQPRVWDQPPESGSLPRAQAQRLVAVLEQFTATAEDCFCAVWDGFGDLAVPTADVATMAMPLDRTMWLLRGTLGDVAVASMLPAPWDQSPNLWWPADRAWCVATDIDLNCSYIGASEACIQAILNTAVLETWRANLDDRIDGESDTYNPTPPFLGGVH